MFHVASLKTSWAGAAPISASAGVTSTVTSAPGRKASRTVKFAVPFSVTEMPVVDAMIAWISSSVTVTGMEVVVMPGAVSSRLSSSLATSSS